MRAFSILTMAVLGAVGIGVGVTASAWSPSESPGWVIRVTTAPAPAGVLELPGQQATIPSCVWSPTVSSITLRQARRTRCSPLAPGRTVGVLESPANGAANYGASDLKIDVRIVRLIGGRFVVGPVLVVAEDASGGVRPLAVYSGDHSLFLYAFGRYPRPDLFRISTESGKVLGETTLDVAYAVVAANASGVFFGSLDEPGPVCFVPDDGGTPIVAASGPVDVDRFVPDGSSMTADVQLATGHPPSLDGVVQSWTFVVQHR